MQSSNLPAEQKEWKAPDLEAQIIPYEFKYLSKLKPAELKNIQTKFNKSAAELDREIGEHQLVYSSKLGKYILALGSNLLYVVFQANTAQDGVPSFIHVFAKDADVPTLVGKLIGYPAAVLDALTYIFNFSPDKVAALETLDYLHQDAFYTRIQNSLVYAKHNPSKAAWDSSKFIFNESLLLLVNTTSIMSEVIAVSSDLNKLPDPAKWILILSILRYGVVYMEQYLNKAYYREIKEYWFNKERPWILLELFKKGEFATLAQILLQAIISTAGIKAFPVYYYLALASEKALGWYPLAPLVALCTAITNIVFLYPTVIKEYTEDERVINNILKEKIDSQELNQILREQLAKLNLNERDDAFVEKLKNQLSSDLIKMQKNLIKEKMIADHGKFYHKNDIKALLHIAYRGFVGGYFGYTCLTPLFLLMIDAPVAIPIITISVSSLAFMDILRRAEFKRIDHKLLRKHLEPENKEDAKTSLATKVAATGLMIGNGTATSMSIMGTLSKIPQNNSSLIRSLVALISIDNMIVVTSYNFNSAINTIKEFSVKKIFGCGKSKPATTPGTLFHQRTTQNAPKSSWNCCRRNRI